MARIPRVQYAGGLYHIMVRGNQRRYIFLEQQDYNVYKERLQRYKKKYDLKYYSYCLLQNHVHLEVVTPQANISKVMQSIQQSYTQYFNLKYKKVGHVFQGRFKSKICETEGYLLTLLRYIHRNVVNAGESLIEYPWSSYREYIGLEKEPICEVDEILNRFSKNKSKAIRLFREFINGEGNKFKELEKWNNLGNEKFINKVEKDKKNKNFEIINRIDKKYSIDKIINIVCRVYQINSGAILGKSRINNMSDARNCLMYVANRVGGICENEIAKVMGRTQPLISLQIKKFEDTIGNNIQRDQKHKQILEDVRNVI